MPSAAFRDQLGTLLPRLRRFARVLTRDPDDADDLVQATLEKAIARAAQWRTENRLDGWVFGIMRNAWIDEIRARRRRAPFQVPEDEGLRVGDPSTSAPELALSIEAALAALPEEQRLAVALVLIEGLSYHEAAASLDVPVGTLTSRLARGRQTLQTLLSDFTEAAP